MNLSINEINRKMLTRYIDQLRYENKVLNARLMEAIRGAADEDQGGVDGGVVKDEVDFTNNQFIDGLWKYTIVNDIAYVSYIGEGGDVEIGTDNQPYSRLIDTNGKTFIVTSFAKLFYNNDELTSIKITNWTAKNIVDTSYMFSNCPNLTSITLNGFNIANTTYMRDMFSNCPNLTDINLTRFNAKSVRDISYMFSGDYKLKSLNLSNLDGNYIMNTSYMFLGCSNLSNLVLGNSRIPAGKEDRTTTGLAPKDGCTITLNVASYNALSSLEFKLTYRMTEWDNANIVNNSTRSVIVTDLEHIASNVTFNANIWRPESGIWKYILDGDEVSVIYDLDELISEIEISSANKPYEKLIDGDGRAYPVTSYANMFYKTIKYQEKDENGNVINELTEINITISDWTNRNITDMHNMFYNCSILKTLTLTNFDTYMVQNMGGMFRGCSGLDSHLALTSFNTEHVTNMNSMFENCSKLKSIDLSTFKTPVVEDVASMFYGCESLETLTLSDSFTTERVTTMSNMFYNCNDLTGVNLNGFDTTSTRFMSYMFYNCSSLTALDLSKFNTDEEAALVAMTSMLYGCTKLGSITLYKKASKILTVFPGGATTWYVNSVQLTGTEWDANWGDGPVTFTRTINA